MAKVGRLLLLLLCWSKRLWRGLQEAQVRRAMTRTNLAKNRWRFRGGYARCAGGTEEVGKGLRSVWRGKKQSLRSLLAFIPGGRG